MKYYDIKKNWQKIKKHIHNKEVQKILSKDFNKFIWGSYRKRFEKGMVPGQFCDYNWRCRQKTKCPEYFDWLCLGACFWLVNFNLKLAQLTEPTLEWRILSGEDHSTVWDGKSTLFDLNCFAMRAPAKQTFKKANGKELPVGELAKVPMALYWKTAIILERLEKEEAQRKRNLCKK